MTVRGTVKKGKVLLNDPTALAEGTEVEVRPVKTRKPKAEVRKPNGDRRSLAERLAKVIGTAAGLPPDAAVNHDHYLYGLPKQQ